MPSRGTIELLQMIADIRQINEPINRPQQVITRHMISQTEPVKQRLLHHRPLAYHRCIPRFHGHTESHLYNAGKTDFFNTITPIGDVRVDPI